MSKQFFHRISIMEHIPAFRRTYFFVFLMQFGLRRVAPFVSSPILSFVMIDLNATKLDGEVRVRRRLGFAPANTITTSTAPRKIWYRAAIFFSIY